MQGTSTVIFEAKK